MNREQTEIDREKQIMEILVIGRHASRARAISMADLFYRVFREDFSHEKSRKLRKIVSEMRRRGLPICATQSREGGGYYMAYAGSDVADYCRARKMAALKILKTVAVLQGKTLPELLGQMSIDMSAPAKEAEVAT